MVEAVSDNVFRVFVYGTLKSGGDIRGLNQFGDGANIIGKTKTTYPDYEMVDLGAFPGVFLNGKNYIEGEVWEVDKETMEDLDAIEGYPNFYNRQVVHTDLGKANMYYLDRKTYGDMANQESPRIDRTGGVDKWML
jgi:gamma-glutamylcyclotransferase (GGCT)/AIG2-like uncharacterized protein YtfP|tara:strand:- start:611 stop:1018 length:408 start_codon:yes stop_codon:yes gene_type:complete